MPFPYLSRSSAMIFSLKTAIKYRKTTLIQPKTSLIWNKPLSLDFLVLLRRNRRRQEIQRILRHSILFFD